ncbi:MAG: hypothetical protein GOV01_00525 [Candidatus Altiarchaeota archaeon]|nr:hypothetical protein [Candidatus Altiarchaeota archaeon]
MGLPTTKTSIDAILSGFTGAETVSLVIEGKPVTRIRIMGRVVDTFLNGEGNYASITIDDETATIRAKFFAQNMSDFKKIQMGDLVDLTGRVKKFQDEVHIITDAVAVFDNVNWGLLRKLELSNPDDGLEKEILGAIKSGTITRKELETKFGESVVETLGVLMNKGEVYESSPSKYSCVE